MSLEIFGLQWFKTILSMETRNGANLGRFSSEFEFLRLL